MAWLAEPYFILYSMTSGRAPTTDPAGRSE
jgi:hypothetical protein